MIGIRSQVADLSSLHSFPLSKSDAIRKTLRYFSRTQYFQYVRLGQKMSNFGNQLPKFAKMTIIVEFGRLIPTDGNRWVIEGLVVALEEFTRSPGSARRKDPRLLKCLLQA